MRTKTLHFLLLCLLLALAGATFAQTLSPQVYSPAGGTGTAGNMTLDWTIGEPMVTTLDNGQLVLTQGFHQPGGAMVSELPAPFITTWNTANPGSSGATQITVPTTGGGYLYHVDWDDDGVYDEFNLTGSVTHDFGVAGTYTIRITGAFPRIYFNNVGDAQKLLSVDQWGATPWTSMAQAFMGCSNMDILASDAPDLSRVTDLSSCFRNCSSLTADLDIWDVLGVTNMANIFTNCAVFNGDVSTWRTDSVTTLNSAFSNAAAFNGDLSAWNTSKVTFMSSTFNSATSFNQPLNTWDVQQVTSMTLAFAGASSFNQPLDQWQLGAVNLLGMFVNAPAFDQDLGSWDISGVTSFTNMFAQAGLSTTNYDATLIGWATLDAGETQIPQNKSFNAGSSRYCLGEAARDLLTGTHGWTIIDGGPDPGCGGVSLALRAFLQGPYNSGTGAMNDGLRANSLIPTLEPYSALSYAFVGGGGESTTQPILDFPGSNAIIDWVVVELRDKNDNTSVLHSRSALLQADGDIVDMDGFSPVGFPVAADNYFISLLHRNHLSVMTLAPVALSGTTATVDLTDGSTATYGTDAQADAAGTKLLWAGDVTFDGIIKYTGAGNDRDPILQAIGGVVPTATLNGYAGEDVNLDGIVKYTGAGNDRDIILQNIGGVVPTNTRVEQVP